MSKRALMIDLETLGSGSRVHVPVLQVGMALFSVEDGVATIHHTWQFDFGLDGATKHPNSPPIDPDTMAWWKTQPDDVLQRVFFPPNEGKDSVHVLHNTVRHLTKYQDYNTLWACGVADFAWLTGLFNRYNLTPPWPYNAPRDYRTVRELANQLCHIEMHPQVGLTHNAVDDAVWQCHMLAKYLKALGLEATS